MDKQRREEKDEHGRCSSGFSVHLIQHCRLIVTFDEHKIFAMEKNEKKVSSAWEPAVGLRSKKDGRTRSATITAPHGMSVCRCVLKGFYT